MHTSKEKKLLNIIKRDLLESESLVSPEIVCIVKMDLFYRESLGTFDVRENFITPKLGRIKETNVNPSLLLETVVARE